MQYGRFAGYYGSSKDNLINQYGFQEGELNLTENRPRVGYRSLGLQDSRYALQKTTLWIASVLFSPPPTKDASFGSPSTKVHIDRMFKNIVEEEKTLEDGQKAVLNQTDFVSKFGKSLLKSLDVLDTGCSSLPESFMKKTRGETTPHPLELSIVTILASLVILDFTSAKMPI